MFFNVESLILIKYVVVRCVCVRASDKLKKIYNLGGFFGSN